MARLTLPCSAALGLALATSAIANTPSGDGWGSSQEHVRAQAVETPVLDAPGRLVHHTHYQDTPVTLNRRFGDDGLWQVRYFNRSVHDEPAAFLTDYQRWQARLTEQYGEPERDVREWRNDSLKEQGGMEGMGLAGGHLTLFTAWETDEAMIVMTLQREHMAMAHQLLFTDPAAVRPSQTATGRPERGPTTPPAP